ncbi:MAG: hypothetical protein ABWX92_12555 [Mycetocola sp.]
MGISRASVLTGHVLGSTIQTMLGLAVVFGVAVAIGFRPDAVPVEWIAAFGVLAMITLALTWLRSHSAWCPRTWRSRATYPCPFCSCRSSAAASSPLDAGRPSMVRGVPALHSLHRDDARTAPGHAIGNSALLTVAWCALIALVGYRWAMKLYNRDPSR